MKSQREVSRDRERRMVRQALRTAPRPPAGIRLDASDWWLVGNAEREANARRREAGKPEVRP